MVAAEDFETRVPKAEKQGTYEEINIVPTICGPSAFYINVKSLLPLKIVANPGNEGAGPSCRNWPSLPCQFFLINETPDGISTTGFPNPLLPGNQAAT